ncbi:MAG: hypothetical protein ACR2RV_14720 [Verrucomicrobiales bacterium]
MREKIPPAVREQLEASFELAKIGGATRLGRQFKELGGARIGPYIFGGSSKLTGGGAFEITIQTEVEFVDPAGNVTDDPGEASGIRETFTQYKVSRSGGSEGGEGTPIKPLSASERERAIAVAKGSYSAVVDAALEFTDGNFEKDEISGSIRRGFSPGGRVLRKLEWQVVTSDHGGFKAEVFCDANGVPSFVLWEDSYWTFDPANSKKTIDHISEKRLYFSPRGQLARSLEKKFKGSGEAEISENRNRASNVDFPANPDGVAVFFESLKRLSEAPEAELPGLADKFLNAWELMHEPDGGG